MSDKTQKVASEFLAKVGKSNRLTIPQLLADQYRLNPGDVVHVRFECVRSRE